MYKQLLIVHKIQKNSNIHPFPLLLLNIHPFPLLLSSRNNLIKKTLSRIKVEHLWTKTRR